MFEFGKKYKLSFHVPKWRSYKVIIEKDMECVSEELPIVKFMRGNQELIVNVSSPSFIKGELQS